MKKRILALIMAVVLVVALAACGEKPTTSTPAPTATTAPEPTKEPTKAPVSAVEEGPASIDFEDGNFGFLALYRPTQTSDKSDVKIIDLEKGGKALYAENTMKKNETHIGIDLAALLGDKIADVKTIKVDIASKTESEGFYPISGKIYLFSGEGNSVSTASDFAVYMENKNPKTITVDVKNAFVAGQNNYMDIAKLSDSAYEEAKRNNKVSEIGVGLVLDNIRFLDAAGNLIAVDSSTLVSDNAPFMQAGSTKAEFVYGSSIYLEAANPGDWAKNADIPACFFEGATGPIGIVLEVAIEDKPDYALIGPRGADWTDLDHSYVIGLNEDKDTAPFYFYQADNSIVFNDFSTTKVAFAVTKEGADYLAAHGGLCFIGHNAYAKKAIISKDTYECAVDAVMPGDWSCGAAIPAAYFAALADKGNVNVTLQIEVADKPDYVGFKIATPSWGTPENAETLIVSPLVENNYFVFQSDGAFSVRDQSATELSFTIKSDAVKYFAENGGMCFPGHMFTVKSAKVSSSTFEQHMEDAAPGDWAKNVDIPAEFFANATGNIGIVLELEIADKPDYALIGPRGADWSDLDHSYIVGVTEDKDSAPFYFYQADNSIVFNDFSLTKACFVVTKEGADYLAEHGGLAFIGHNTWVKKAYVSTNRYETLVDSVMPGDWSTGNVIPAVYFEGAENGVSVTLTIEIADKPDYLGFKIANKDWASPEKVETMILAPLVENNTFVFQSDGAFSIRDQSLTQISFVINAEAAKWFAENGGMAFPGHMFTVKSAVVTKK